MKPLELHTAAMDFTKATEVREPYLVLCIKPADMKESNAKALDRVHCSSQLMVARKDPDAIAVFTLRDPLCSRKAERLFEDMYAHGEWPAMKDAVHTEIISQADFERFFSRVAFHDSHGRTYDGKAFIAQGYRNVRAAIGPNAIFRVVKESKISGAPGHIVGGGEPGSVIVHNPANGGVDLVSSEAFKEWYCPKGSKRSFDHRFPEGYFLADHIVSVNAIMGQEANRRIASPGDEGRTTGRL